MSTDQVRIIDLDTYEPSDAEIVSWHEMMTARDQLAWEYDDSWARQSTTPQQQIDSFRKRRVEQRGRNHPLWAIVQGKVVGMIGINRFDDPPRRHSAELGYGVAAAFTRRGIGIRLVTTAIGKARELGLKRLQAGCAGNNVASIALLRTCGFQEEGLRIAAICKDGKFIDERLFALML